MAAPISIFNSWSHQIHWSPRSTLKSLSLSVWTQASLIGNHSANSNTSSPSRFDDSETIRNKDSKFLPHQMHEIQIDISIELHCVAFFSHSKIFFLHPRLSCIGIQIASKFREPELCKIPTAIRIQSNSSSSAIWIATVTALTTMTMLNVAMTSESITV